MLATIVRFCIQKMNLLKGVVDLVLLASTFVNNHMTMVYEYVGKKKQSKFCSAAVLLVLKRVSF